MSHNETQELLGCLALGELEGDELAAVEAHVEACETCRQDLADMQATFSLLTQAVSALPDAELAPDRRNAVLAPLAEEEASLTVVTAPRAPVLTWVHWLGVAAVVVIMLSVAAVMNLQMGRGSGGGVFSEMRTMEAMEYQMGGGRPARRHAAAQTSSEPRAATASASETAAHGRVDFVVAGQEAAGKPTKLSLDVRRDRVSREAASPVLDVPAQPQMPGLAVTSTGGGAIVDDNLVVTSTAGDVVLDGAAAVALGAVTTNAGFVTFGDTVTLAGDLALGTLGSTVTAQTDVPDASPVEAQVVDADEDFGFVNGASLVSTGASAVAKEALGKQVADELPAVDFSEPTNVFLGSDVTVALGQEPGSALEGAPAATALAAVERRLGEGAADAPSPPIVAPPGQARWRRSAGKAPDPFAAPAPGMMGGTGGGMGGMGGPAKKADARGKGVAAGGASMGGGMGGGAGMMGGGMGMPGGGEAAAGEQLAFGTVAAKKAPAPAPASEGKPPDRKYPENHEKFGNVQFGDGAVKGFAGKTFDVEAEPAPRPTPPAQRAPAPAKERAAKGAAPRPARVGKPVAVVRETDPSAPASEVNRAGSLVVRDARVTALARKPKPEPGPRAEAEELRPSEVAVVLSPTPKPRPTLRAVAGVERALKETEADTDKEALSERRQARLSLAPATVEAWAEPADTPAQAVVAGGDVSLAAASDADDDGLIDLYETRGTKVVRAARKAVDRFSIVPKATAPPGPSPAPPASPATPRESSRRRAGREAWATPEVVKLREAQAATLETAEPEAREAAGVTVAKRSAGTYYYRFDDGAVTDELQGQGEPELREGRRVINAKEEVKDVTVFGALWKRVRGREDARAGRAREATPAQSLAMMKALPALSPQQELLGQAVSAQEEGNAEQARQVLNQLLVEYPKSAEATRGQGLIEELDEDEQEEEAAGESDDAELPPTPRTPPPPVNPFVLTAQDRFSTFSLETDTASYSLTRRYIRRGYRPPPGVVRMEEFVNAFDYNYPPQTERVFTVQAEAGPAPFGKGLVLLNVGVKGKVLGRDGRKPAHLVFAVDASGSMGRDDRMPLVKYALSQLVGQLGADDRVTLVAYGTQPRLLLEAVPASTRKQILDAVEAIECGASTNMLGGIELGYQLAARHYRAGQINRVIVCSDGVANVGPSDAESLLTKVDRYRRQGVTLTTVGVGAGSYDDRMLEQLANKGDGNYVFIDTRAEARRVFVEELSATLQTIAKDVKIQVEFEPERVRRYRLIGYENRAIADRDFRNDKVDAGEIGSGQSATALYELELHDAEEVRGTDLGTVFVRYRDLDSGKVEEISSRLEDGLVRERSPETDPRFYLAACVAEFAEILRGSEHAGDGSLEALEQVAIGVANALPLDRRVRELVSWVRRAQGLPQAK